MVGSQYYLFGYQYHYIWYGDADLFEDRSMNRAERHPYPSGLQEISLERASDDIFTWLADITRFNRLSMF